MSDYLKKPIHSNTSAVESVRHFMHIYILMNNHADLFEPGFKEMDNEYSWFFEGSDDDQSLGGCYLETVDLKKGNHHKQSKIFSLEEVAQTLYEAFPEEFTSCFDSDETGLADKGRLRLRKEYGLRIEPEDFS